MADLSRADFDSCLDFLAGDLAAPPGAYEPEPGSTPKWTAPRIWKRGGLFGIRSRRVIRWFWSNVGTITSEESVRVQVDGQVIGTLEGAYAERLQAGDRFVLDGRSLEFRRMEGLVVHAKASGGEPNLPRWSSDRQGLSAELARDVASFRARAGEALAEGPSSLRAWLGEEHDIGTHEAGVLETLFAGSGAGQRDPRRRHCTGRGISRSDGRRLRSTPSTPRSAGPPPRRWPGRRPPGWVVGSAGT